MAFLQSLTSMPSSEHRLVVRPQTQHNPLPASLKPNTNHPPMSLSLLHKRDFLRHPLPGKMTMVSRSSGEVVVVPSVEGSGDSEGPVSAVLSSRGVAREAVVDSVEETEVRGSLFYYADLVDNPNLPQVASEVVEVALALKEIGVAEVVPTESTVLAVVEGGVEDPAVRLETSPSFFR